MSRPTYTIRHASWDDVDDVIALRVHAEDWLHAAGIDQWTVRQTGVNGVQKGIADGTSYVIEHEDTVIGSFTIGQADLDFWTVSEALQPAAYLYKFMIRSDHRGTGLGDQVLDWVCASAEASGRPVVRLDCWKSNTLLHMYYLRRGFKRVGLRHAPGRQSGALFERPSNLRIAEQRVELVDATDRPVMTGRYDPTGAAAVLLEAAAIVLSGKRGEPGSDWDTALDQAARALDAQASRVKQRGGMYYRVLDGKRRDTPDEGAAEARWSAAG